VNIIVSRSAVKLGSSSTAFELMPGNGVGVDHGT